ncbi:hypothetical protein DYB37_003420 [Aphanomyces astaci]|uniref:Dynein assembly factor 3 C-terminal domain-containing protein n=2 Tax=Aphanomyces astaci TaxID=112090 RepID=A0A418EP78_APHAT|nr:hypothetical protein DYB37_003420 [Aphanomyces astaci]
MWGFSPGFDLQEGVSEPRADSNQVDASTSSSEPLCVLVLSPGDIRHVLATIARSRRWKKRPLHIYLYEKSPECLARALLLLQIVNDWEVPLRQRCNTFLEVFGNALVQQFKEWRNTGIAFEFGDQQYTAPNRTMASYTDAVKKGHGSVSCRGYWLDIVVGPYISFGVDCYRNTTEVAVFNVLSHLHEIETGDIYKMKKVGILYICLFCHPCICQAHDVYSGIGEIEDGKARDRPVQDNNSPEANNNGPRGDELPRFEELDHDDDACVHCIISMFMSFNTWLCRENVDARKRAQRIVESFEGVKVHTEVILLSGAAADLAKKRRYQRRFHHVYVSVHATNLVTSPDVDAPMTTLLADDAKVSVESSLVIYRYLLPFKDDQRVTYMQKLVEFAGSMGLTTSKRAFGASDAFKKDNAVLKFQYTRTQQQATD